MKQPPTNDPAGPRHYTYLALGDSYTIGEKVDLKDNFPNQVVALMNQRGFQFAKPRIVAQTGWTTDELQSAIDKTKLDDHYDFVTLLIGVNNQYRGRKVADFVPEFDSLLRQAIRFAGMDTNHVIVLSIPDWGVTPFAEDRDRQQVSKEIDDYNAAIEGVTKNNRIHYINITTGTREASRDHSLLASDELHPSAKEYAKWALKVASFMKEQL